MGVALGLPLAILVGKALTPALYGVMPFDPGSYLVAAVLVAI
jgi:hypothetical protein